MDDLNSYRCSYISGMSKVLFPFLNFQGNIKGISLVWSQSIKTPIINILTEVIMSLNIFLKYEVVRLVVCQSYIYIYIYIK